MINAIFTVMLGENVFANFDYTIIAKKDPNTKTLFNLSFKNLRNLV